MKVYGITGGAGTGKSEVLRILKDQFKAYVILTDDVARDLTLKGGISYKLIVEHFGQDVLLENGELNRPKVANIVFNDPKELEALNNMTHPYVRKEVERQIAEAEKSGLYDLVAVESAILLDSGYEDICEEYWYVYTKPEIRRERMKVTRGYSDEKVDAVMKNQPADEKFFEKCAFVIENNTTLEAIEEQLHRKLD